MKRRNERQSNLWRAGAARPHRPERHPIYPLPRSLGARPPLHDEPDGPAGADVSRTAPFPVADAQVGRRPYPRGVRRVAWLLLAAVPLIVIVWAASILVPVAIETQQAVGKVFVTPVPRDVLTQVQPRATATSIVPSDTADSGLTATPGNQGSTQDSGPTPTPTVAPPTPTPFPEWDGERPIHILLLGVDAREVADSPPRSDTIIIVRIDPVAKRVDMMSIPRDLLVMIPGYYETKINAAYPFGMTDPTLPGGGPTLVRQTILANFGIYIDFFAEVDIAGMEQVIDTLGGIVIDVAGIVKDDQYPTDDYGYTRVYFSPGIQRMDGETAVRYSRTRHDDGDFARQERQQQVLMAIREQAIDSGAITRLPELISQTGESIRTDLKLSQMFALAGLAQDIDSGDIYTHSMLPYLSEQWIGDGYFLVADWEAVQAVVADLPSDPAARRINDPEPVPDNTQQ